MRVGGSAQGAGRLSTDELGVSVCAGRFRRCLLFFAETLSRTLRSELSLVRYMY